MTAPAGEKSTTRTFLPYFIVSGSLSLGYGSIYTLLPALRDELGFSEQELGVLVGVGFFTGVLAQVWLSRYADRGYASIMVRAGIAIAAVSALTCAVSTELWQFIAARAFLGLGSGMVGPAIRRVVIARDPERIGENLGKQGSFDISGFVLGPLLAGGIAELFDFQAPFWALFLLYVGIFFVGMRLDLSAARADSRGRALRSLLALPPIRAALSASIAFYITIGMFEAVWALLLTDLGARKILISITLSLFTVPMIFLAPTGGRYAQRYGPLRVAGFSVLVAALCTLSYGFLPLWPVLVISALHAVADSFTMPANQVAVAISSPPEHVGAGQGLLGAVGLTVAGIVAVIGGGVYGHFGRGALFIGTAASMLAFLAWAFFNGAGLRQPAVKPEITSPQVS
ncbi:MAG: MFS transporter [Acidimicrobiales bacterium]